MRYGARSPDRQARAVLRSKDRERGGESVYPNPPPTIPPLFTTNPALLWITSKIIATYFQDTAPNYLPLKYSSLRFALVVYHLFTYLVTAGQISRLRPVVWEIPLTYSPPTRSFFRTVVRLIGFDGVCAEGGGARCYLYTPSRQISHQRNL